MLPSLISSVRPRARADVEQRPARKAAAEEAILHIVFFEAAEVHLYHAQRSERRPTISDV